MGGRTIEEMERAMLSGWLKIMPYFFVIWLTKRYAERFDFLKPEHHSAVPFRDEVISWEKAKEARNG